MPLSLQVTPQKGQENAEEQPETWLPREVKAWLYSKCATEGCKCKGSWNGVHNQTCCRRCAPNHPCSQQFGSSHPNHDGPSVVPAGWMAKKMPWMKDALVETLHELGITAQKKLLMKSTQAGLVAQTWAA